MDMTNGQQVIDAARAWLARYTRLTAAQNLVLVLWAFHTHVYTRLSRTTPYVELTGVSGSGKTTVMRAVLLLSRGSLELNTIRTAAICRYLKEHSNEVTLGIDEAERLKSGSFGDQRSMLASGYSEGGQHLVSEGKTATMYPSYCPKMFTSTGTLTTVLHNRCIPIWCERGKPTASMELEHARATAQAAQIMAGFQGLHRLFTKVQTIEPLWLADERDQQIWTALFTLAATMGVNEATMRELRAASIDLSALRGVVRSMDTKDEDANARERSYAVKLLSDVQSVLRENDAKGIPAAELIERLRAIDVAPWRHYKNGLTADHLGQLLGCFVVDGKAIESKSFARGSRPNRTIYRGYDVATLRAAKA